MDGVKIGLLRTKRLCARIRSPFSYFLIVGGVFIFVSYYIIIRKEDTRIQNVREPTVEGKSTYRPNRAQMHLAIVVCGERFEQGLVLLKSVALLTRSPFHVYIFTTEDLMAGFKKELNSWPASFRRSMNYSLLPVQFPTVSNVEVWRNLFRPCASQRLFLPLILKHLDAVLYVDSDVLFLRPLDDIWRIFDDFNETQIAAMVSEREVPDDLWFSKHKNTPRVPPYGVNTGVFLMNTTRMRQVDWLSNITSLHNVYKKRVIKLGVQDLANLYFRLFPERLYWVECQWNFRSDHCSFKNNACESAKAKGASLIHGSRKIFHNNIRPIFRALYQTFRDYHFTEDPVQFFSRKILEIMLNGNETMCQQVAKIILRQLHVNLVLLEKESVEQDVLRL